MHSSRPDCVFGDARLISSTSTTLANTGPGRNSKRASLWLKTFVPTTSAGSRSAVHWMRAYSASTDRAIALASAVLPTPGLSSIRTCPSATTLTSRSLRAVSGTLTALATFAATRWPSAATPSGSSSGTVDICGRSYVRGGPGGSRSGNCDTNVHRFVTSRQASRRGTNEQGHGAPLALRNGRDGSRDGGAGGGDGRSGRERRRRDGRERQQQR